MELLESKGWQWGIQPEGGVAQYFPTPADAMTAAFAISGPLILFTQNNDEEISARIQVGHRTADGEWIEDQDAE